MPFHQLNRGESKVSASLRVKKKESKRIKKKELGIKPLHTSFCCFFLCYLFLCVAFVLTKSVPAWGGRTLAQCRSVPDACVMKSVTEQIKKKEKGPQKRGKYRNNSNRYLTALQEDLRKIKRQTTKTKSIVIFLTFSRNVGIKGLSPG